jgi:hypothetical protein
MQLGTTISGVNDLVTGRLAGAFVGSNDVDGGTTSIVSPPIALPANMVLTLTFHFYFAHLSNASSADFFRVSVVTGNGATVILQKLGAPTTVPAGFAATSANISSFAGQTVRILIEVADTGPGSLVEAAVDDVSITAQ